MQVVRLIINIIFILDCIALAVVVLKQEGKASGLGAVSGVSTGLSDTYWAKNKGRSKEGVLVKATRYLAIGFIVMAVVLNLNF